MRAREVLEALFDKDTFDVQWKNQLNRAEALLAKEGINVELCLVPVNLGDTIARFRQKGEGGSIYPLFTVGARLMRSPERALSHAALLAKQD